MQHRTKPLREQVILITGASSGIGLRTAQLAAGRGARVVMVARNEDALRTAAETLSAEGGEVTYAVADVADPEQMAAAAQVALDEFGRIDTWVNNAGVGVYGLSQDIPLSEARRLMDINFWGVVHGTRCAVKAMRESGGTIINIGSIESEISLPYHSFYSASKHAIKAFTDTVRVELEKEHVPIAMTTIKPASINTPFIDHAKNRISGGVPEYLPPVYSVDIVARAILECSVHPRRDLTIGSSGRLFEFIENASPNLLDRVMERVAFRGQRRASRPTAKDQSNLFMPSQLGGETDGSHQGFIRNTSVTTLATLHPWRSLAAIAAIGGLGAFLLRSRRREVQAIGRAYGDRDELLFDEALSPLV